MMKGRDKVAISAFSLLFNNKYQADCEPYCPHFDSGWVSETGKTRKGCFIGWYDDVQMKMITKIYTGTLVKNKIESIYSLKNYQVCFLYFCHSL